MMRLRFRQFIFCWFLAFFAGTSTAQEATQASLPEQVYYESAIVVFPQAIRFQVVVDVPAIQIAFITLQISPPDGEPILININPFTATITEPFTDLTVQWDVPPTMPPPLFSEISYQWRIITQRDQVIMFDRQVVFADTRAQWEQNEDASGRLNLTFPIGLVEAGRLRTSLRDYFDLLEQTSRQPISLRLLLYGDGLRPGCDRDLSGQPVVRYQDGPEIAEVPCNLELAEAIFRRSGYTVLEITSRSALERAIWDLAFDAAYNRAWDALDVPLWFRQGLRDWYRPISKIGYLGTAQNASRTDALIPLGLLDDTPTAPNQRAIWEAQSYGLVLFIAEQGGVDALYEIARGLGSDMTLDELVRQTIGVSLSALQRDWESWIFTRSAESTYAFIPYGGPTPTPPPPTNTLTATPSFTPTDTLTPTVTGVLSPTPSNTPTPTHTPTPTITPRPAVSFVIGATPTRAPTAEEAPSTPLNQTQLLVIGVGVILLALLALLYYLFGRQE